MFWSDFFVVGYLGTPCYMDSEGCVRMLNRGLGNTWTPVCNVREHCKGKSDHYWVVGIHENPQQLRWAITECREWFRSRGWEKIAVEPSLVSDECWNSHLQCCAWLQLPLRMRLYKCIFSVCAAEASTSISVFICFSFANCWREN